MLSFKPLIKRKNRPCRIFYQQHILPTWQQISCASASILDKAIQVFSGSLFVVASANTPWWLQLPLLTGKFWDSLKEAIFTDLLRNLWEALASLKVIGENISNVILPYLLDAHISWGGSYQDCLPGRRSQLQTQFTLAWHVYKKKKKACSCFQICWTAVNFIVSLQWFTLLFLCLLLWKFGRAVEWGEVLWN